MVFENGQPQGYRHDGSRQLRRELATQAAAQFINGLREPGGEFQRAITLKRNAPAWVKETFRAVQHGPQIDDWRSRTAREALHTIAEAPLHASIDQVEAQFAKATDTYNADLLRWLGSDTERPGYCDEALHEGLRPESLFQMLGAGQALELREIFQRVARAIEDEQYRRELKAGTLNPESGLALIPTP